MNPYSEGKAFITLQQLFAKRNFLAHFNLVKHLYINVDALEQYGFEAVVYHVDEDVKETADIQRQKIHLILFVSKLLTPAEGCMIAEALRHLSHLDLDVRHRPRQIHLVPDAFTSHRPHLMETYTQISMGLSTTRFHTLFFMF